MRTRLEPVMNYFDCHADTLTEIADDEPPPLLHFRGRYSSV